MVGVKKFYQSKLSHELITTFTRSTSSLLDGHGEDRFITRQKEVLKELTNEMDRAFQRNLVSDFTAKLVNLDDKRDAIIIALRSTLNAAIDQAFLNESKAKAANEIKIALDKMPSNVTRIGYKEESAHIIAFIAAVKELGPAVEKADIIELMQVLESVETEFDTLHSQKMSNEGNQERIRQITHIRKDIARRLDGLFGYLDLNGEDYQDEFSESVTSINELIGEFMAKAKATKTREENSTL